MIELSYSKCLANSLSSGEGELVVLVVAGADRSCYKNASLVMGPILEPSSIYMCVCVVRSIHMVFGL